jgi:hypothetical protein
MSREKADLSIIAALATVCLAASIPAPVRAESAQGFGDAFITKKAEAYLANAQQLRSGQVEFRPVQGGHGNCMVVSKNTRITFLPVAIKENLKYRLSFGVRVDAPETIEDNPRLGLTLRQFDSWLPCLRGPAFLDKESKPVKIARGRVPALTLPFGNWFSFVKEFHSPPRAQFLQLEFDTKGDSTLFLRDLVLAPEEGDGAINVNPTFSLGKYNHSGWLSLSRLLERPSDGRVLFDSCYGASGEPFPVSEPGMYRLYARGSSYGRYSDIILKFLGADDRVIYKVSMKPTLLGAQKEFRLPPGTTKASFLVYNSILEEIRLTRIGNEDHRRN